MPEGGTLTIETANTEPHNAHTAADGEVLSGQRVMLAVSDTGIGMPKEVIEKAFEPFFTNQSGRSRDRPRPHPGLWPCQTVRWRVDVHSVLDEGAAIKLYLPRLAAGEVQFETTADEQHVPLEHRFETSSSSGVDRDVRAYSAGGPERAGLWCPGDTGWHRSAAHVGAEAGDRPLVCRRAFPGA
jgi:histidine kinase/DNA gyrase B/HSP90-like ATPase